MSATDTREAGTINLVSEDTTVVQHSGNEDILFVNWSEEVEGFDHCDLIDGTELHKYKLVFFDPLNFALRRKLWKADNDCTETCYFGMSESSFKNLLSRIRVVNKSLGKLLDSGGTFVVRSNIPQSYIKIKKKSRSSNRSKTDSIVSTFFWLEEYTGRCQFRESGSKSIRFADPEHSLARFLGDCPVKHMLTQTSIGKGRVEIIAVASNSQGAPAISAIRSRHYPGQILFLPQFDAADESQRLAAGLEAWLQFERESADRPRWLDYYERQLSEYNPYSRTIQKLETKIEQYTKRRKALLRRQDEFSRLSVFLTGGENGLLPAMFTALEVLGYSDLSPVEVEGFKVVKGLAAGCTPRRTFFAFADVHDGPVETHHLESLVEEFDLEEGTAFMKLVVIANVFSDQEPEARPLWFSQECEETSRRLNIALIPSIEFYLATITMMSRLESSKIDAIRDSLRRDIHQSDAEFRINRKKYGI